MAFQNAIPTFGVPLKDPDYYTVCDSVCNTLRPYSTLRTVANHLNAMGLRTPTGREWHRLHVANYIRRRGLSKNTDQHTN